MFPAALVLSGIRMPLHRLQHRGLTARVAPHRYGPTFLLHPVWFVAKMRVAMRTHGKVRLRSSPLPCAHAISMLPQKNKLLAFHPGTEYRSIPPEIQVFDDQARASQLHEAFGKGIWTEYRGSYPGLLRTYKTLTSRVAVKSVRFAKMKSMGDLVIDPASEDIAELWEESREEKAQRSDRVNRLHLRVNMKGECTEVPDFPATRSLVRLMDSPEIPADVTGALVPYHVVRAMRSADEWENKGVPVAALGGASLHPRFGVFPPTRQDYIDLFAAHLPSICSTLPSPWHAEDLGSGSGILSFLLAKNGAASVHGLDISLAAVESAAADAKRLSLSSIASFYVADLTQKLTAEQAVSLPRPHLIVCNPPWLEGECTSLLDGAVYDPDYIMLRSSLLYARRRLHPEGRLLMIYSDLAVHLGFCEPTFLATTAAQAGFRVLQKFRLPANVALEGGGLLDEESNPDIDYFKKVRQLERVSLYVLGRRTGTQEVSLGCVFCFVVELLRVLQRLDRKQRQALVKRVSFHLCTANKARPVLH